MTMTGEKLCPSCERPMGQHPFSDCFIASDPAPPTQGAVPGEPLTPDDNRAKVPKPTPDPSEPGSEQEAMEAAPWRLRTVEAAVIAYGKGEASRDSALKAIRAALAAHPSQTMPCSQCGGTMTRQDYFACSSCPESTAHPSLDREVERLRAILDHPDPEDFVNASTVEAKFQMDLWGTTEGFPTAFDGREDHHFVYLIAYLVGKVAATADGDREKKLHRITTIAAAAANWHIVLKERLAATPLDRGAPTAVERERDEWREKAEDRARRFNEVVEAGREPTDEQVERALDAVMEFAVPRLRELSESGLPVKSPDEAREQMRPTMIAALTAAANTHREKEK